MFSFGGEVLIQALWGFLSELHRIDFIKSRKMFQRRCVSLRPEDKHTLQGNFSIGVNMGGEFCHRGVTLPPLSVSKHRKMQFLCLCHCT